MSAPAAPAEPAGGGGAAAPAAAAGGPPLPLPLVAPAGESDLDGGDENEVPELISGGSDYESDDALWPVHAWPAGGLHGQLAWPGPVGPHWHAADNGGLVVNVANANMNGMFNNGGGGGFGGGNLVRRTFLSLRCLWAAAACGRLTRPARSSRTCWRSCCRAAAGAARAAPGAKSSGESQMRAFRCAPGRGS